MRIRAMTTIEMHKGRSDHRRVHLSYFHTVTRPTERELGL